MKILLTADPPIPVPPAGYGGIERIVDGLVRNYRAHGHTVGPVSYTHLDVYKRQGEDIQTIFDVGANVGDWSTDCAGVFGTAFIHSFEPVPATYRVLASRVESESRIIPHPFGLSNADGDAEFTYYGPENSFLSTMVAPVHDHLQSTRVSIKLRKGDDVLRELSVSRIDLLKIDVEGMEHDVLEGLSNAFSEGRIGLVQFEKQPGNRLLKDLSLIHI